ncbi:2'-5' RNA ligase family protein [Halogeometricum sp. S1BR25-6]|uniref:2'-5' RNA ligase family protein n=1 Tax=Halogeometricum salsisoli TaxID=2950536 RepID=A0ABU2G9Y2_9EURY|nr:2'-5' RNA ligase family protein [Halogeometricum sp. S1BR25-6]MDS0297276.1 2'-5' RNA ligase family protein [Halogeometricum sp. S1BR25-6]
MFSLNVPIPGRVERLASELHPALTSFDSIRDRHSLVLKRFDTALDADADSLPHLRERLRGTLRGVGPFEIRTDGIGAFEIPTKGPGPVVYLAIESPGLFDLHDRLCAEFGTVPEMEGDDYTPHVTLARGGRIEDARTLVERDIEEVGWTVEEVRVWDGRYRENAARIPL